MATVTKYDVLSPDKFSISFDEVWDTPELDELETWCEIIPIEVDECPGCVEGCEHCIQK